MWKRNEDIVEFSRELKRMCHSYHICKGCPLQKDINCLSVTTVSPEKVRKVAEWVYENPEPSAVQVIETNKLMADFQEYWGADIPEEATNLYEHLINWLEDEFSKESIAVKI